MIQDVGEVGVSVGIGGGKLHASAKFGKCLVPVTLPSEGHPQFHVCLCQGGVQSQGSPLFGNVVVPILLPGKGNAEPHVGVCVIGFEANQVLKFWDSLLSATSVHESFGIV